VAPNQKKATTVVFYSQQSANTPGKSGIFSYVAKKIMRLSAIAGV
jgi:hypothetical protein